MTAFNEVAPVLLSGMSAPQLADLMLTNPAEYEAVFSANLYKQYLLKCKAKTEVVNDQQFTKVTILAAQPLDFVAENHRLLAELEA
jgi:replication factor A1